MRAALALLLLGLLLVAASGAASHTRIQPGERLETSVTVCTLGFVFDGVGALAGQVFVSTAAHCVANVGEPVTSQSYDGFGLVAWIGDEGDVRRDHALIEVLPAFHHLVDAAVKGHPGYPATLASAADTAMLDLVQLSGFGPPNVNLAEMSIWQEERVGTLTGHTEDIHQIVAPVVGGDSGGPLVHIPTGGALGLVSRTSPGCACVHTERGPTIEHLLVDARANGFTVELRTV